MKKIYRKAVLFWFVLLVAAFVNAIIRETTYKPILSPYIGTWAHQISSLTGIALFFVAIYLFLKREKGHYTRRSLVHIGLLWIVMTIIFESFMNVCVRSLSWEEVMQTYYFWEGNTWIFVLLSLLVSPLIINRMIKNK